MLLIRRKAGERLVIGREIVVTVLEIRGNLVRLGCEAPASVAINREEISYRPHASQAERMTAPEQSPYFSECA